MSVETKAKANMLIVIVQQQNRPRIATSWNSFLLLRGTPSQENHVYLGIAEKLHIFAIIYGNLAHEFPENFVT